MHWGINIIKMSEGTSGEQSKEEGKAGVSTKIAKESELDAAFKRIISHLPDKVKPKFAALKYLANKRDDLSDQLEKEIQVLEEQFDADCIPLDKLREELINGKRDPTSTELSKLSQYNALQGKVKVPEGINIEELKMNKSIPGFWLRVFQNCDEIKQLIKPSDMPILKHLIDLRKVPLDGNNYKIVFTFAPNDFFNNSELTKTMIMDPEEPGDCKESKGTEIEWKEGKDVTKKVVKKKQKNKKTKAVREVTKTITTDSFFNYFKSRTAPDEYAEQEIESDEEKTKEETAFTDDLIISEQICDELIPEAIYYYLGIAEDKEEDIKKYHKGI